MATIGSFTLIKNESLWIGAHLLAWLPLLDQMVFFDGDSTDGTLEILRGIRDNHPLGKKITLVEGKDPKDLRDDYVRVFDECLKTVDQDYSLFLHPDMFPGLKGWENKLDKNFAYSSTMLSFAGDTMDDVSIITTGRTDKWKNIYRMRDPDLGAHYNGWYGAANEDVYFEAITGKSHPDCYLDFRNYPYPVGDSGLKILHFSDVRPYKRRLGRMVTCLKNQGHSAERADEIALAHPRVTLKEGGMFTFRKVPTPGILNLWREYTGVKTPIVVEDKP